MADVVVLNRAGEIGSMLFQPIGQEVVRGARSALPRQRPTAEVLDAVEGFSGYEAIEEMAPDGDTTATQRLGRTGVGTLRRMSCARQPYEESRPAVAAAQEARQEVVLDLAGLGAAARRVGELQPQPGQRQLVDDRGPRALGDDLAVIRPQPGYARIAQHLAELRDGEGDSTRPADVPMHEVAHD